MFKVSGWSLPVAAPAVQVDTSTKKKTKRGKTKKDFASGSNSVEVTPEVAQKIKERERASRVAAERQEIEDKKEIARNGGGDTTTVVNEDNIDKLWKKVIEGAGAEGPKKRKRGSAGGKNRKLAPGEVRAVKIEVEEEEAEEEGGEPKRKKTLKEKRREKKLALLGGDAPETATKTTKTTEATKLAAPIPAAANVSNLTPLQLKMRAKLTSARFRHINETLYTTPSNDSLGLFAEQPDMYTEYHLGFRQQVSVWPSNPVDNFITTLRTRSNIKFSKGYSKTLNSTSVLPLPRDRDSGICTVADLGCGDAKIAATFNHGKGMKDKIKVLSYDLQASTPDVTIADVANLPLEKESVDVVIFCLALMGTNFLEFIDEAHRILKWRGELWVAEIKSRFNRKQEGGGSGGPSNVVGRKKGEQVDAEDGDEPELAGVGGEKRGVPEVYKNFIDALSKRGFVLKNGVDAENKMFVRMEFVKQPEAGARDDDEEEMTGRAAQGGGSRGGRGGFGGGFAARGGRGGFGGGRGGSLPMSKKKSKFIEDGNLSEAQIMKPCVYKLR